MQRLPPSPGSTPRRPACARHAQPRGRRRWTVRRPACARTPRRKRTAGRPARSPTRVRTHAIPVAARLAW